MTEIIFKQEEKAILLSVDKAKASSNNAQTIGRNGEIPLQTFLNSYLPHTLKAVSGHFLTPESIKSPQIDIMILDSRYPLLAYNSDGTVLAMAHSVLKIIEVKTNLKKNDIEKTANNFSKIRALIKDIWTQEESEWSKPLFKLIAYKIATKFDKIEEGYFECCEPEQNHFDISILRTDDSTDLGHELHFEPGQNKWEDSIEDSAYLTKDGFILTIFQERTPLSDFYYSLIQNCYYTLDSRNYSFGEIASQFNEYLNWSTVDNIKK